MVNVPPHAVFTTDKEIGHFAPFRNDQLMVEEQSLTVTVLCTRTGPALCGHDLEAATLARTWAPTLHRMLTQRRPRDPYAVLLADGTEGVPDDLVLDGTVEVLRDDELAAILRVWS